MAVKEHSESGDNWRRRTQNAAHCRGGTGSFQPVRVLWAQGGDSARDRATTGLVFPPPPKMAIHSLTIDGIEVQIEGNGPRTVVMIHGWPDTHRLWDGTVGALQDRYRCVRFTLPGFDASLQPRPTSLAAMVTLFRSIVDAVSPAHPVTLSSPAFRCASGCSPCPRGCGTSCNATERC